MKFFSTFMVLLSFGAAGAVWYHSQNGAAAEYISRGEAFSLTDHLPPEHDDLVLFQFTAEWCGPCQRIEPQVREFVNMHDRLSRRKIDINSWDSPAATQMREYFDATSIPFFALYDGRGEPIAVGGLDQIVRAVERRTR